VARFLIVVPPLVGHVSPTIALGMELEHRGHQVAWAGHRSVVAPLLAPGTRLIALNDEVTEDLVRQVQEGAQRLRGAAALEFLWRDVLLPLAASMVEPVEAAVDAFDPDVLVVDQQAFAGGIVARRRGLCWVTSASTSAELVDPLAALPRVADWVRRGLVELQEGFGIDPSEAAAKDLRFSEHLTIAYTTAALVGTPSLPPNAGPVLMVGPSISRSAEVDRRNRASDFPLHWLEEGGPRILVTLGTINADIGGRFFARVVEAVEGSGVRAVLVAPPEIVGEVPENVLVRPSIPQLAVLDHVDAVVCHAGHNTVCESLAKGLPLVVAPIRDDQPVIAQQVVTCGAGIRVRFGRVSTAEMRSAIDGVLDDPSYRSAARDIKGSFERAGGVPAAAEQLESLAARWHAGASR
jgi:MGT family glycosyltransferase